MSDNQLTEETKVKLVKYAAKLIKHENGEQYRKAFNKAMKENEGFTASIASAIDTQNAIMQEQIDELSTLIAATEQKTELVNSQYKNFQLANLVLLFTYYAVLVGVKGLMLIHYLSSDVVRDEWVDSVMLTLLFIFPYVIYSIEMWIYEMFSKIFKYIFNTSRIPDFNSLMVKTDMLGSPGDGNPNFK